MLNPELDSLDRLNHAIRKNDHREICQAKCDYALSLIGLNRYEEALIHIEQAIGIADHLNDIGLLTDLMSNHGLVLLSLDRISEAQVVLRSALSKAVSNDDDIYQKLILERYAQSCSRLGDSAKAIASLVTATEIARKVGDKSHEFRLLWLQAIEYAGMSQKNQAVLLGVEALGILRSIGADEARWYAEQLRKYRDEGSMMSRELRSGDIHRDQPAAGPGLLRMAISATKAMATFLGTGMKLASEEIREARLSACDQCEHHTGLRCRVCGCFTQVKSGMAHERCPIGRWQD